MKNDKVKAVKKWKILTKIKEIENFLRFTDFYRYFIKNFTHIVKSLNELKEKKEMEMER